jgi:hypothetical protein
MSFNPFNDLIKEIKDKMKSIISDKPYIAVINSNGKYHYFDEKLTEQKKIIEDFNRNLSIDIGQYSLPISAPLGFFRISETSSVVIFLEGGQSGNLLLFQGIINNYTPKILEYIENIEKMEEIERRAHKIIHLRKKEAPKSPEEVECPLLRQEYRAKKFSFNEGLVLKHCTGTTPIIEIIESTNLPRAEILSIIETYREKGWIEIVTTMDVEDYIPKEEASMEFTEGEEQKEEQVPENVEIYPFLLEKFQEKKFSFEEGQVIQFCDGKHSIGEIAEKIDKSEIEVLDIVNKYQSKGWIDVESK